jgi:WD40 repeat protein
MRSRYFATCVSLVALAFLIVTGLAIWVVAAQFPQAPLPGHSSGVTSVVFSPDGKTLASASSDDTIRLWRVSERKIVQTLKCNMGGVNGLAYSPDGQILASAGSDGTVRLWSMPGGVLQRTLAGHSASVQAVAFSPDGRTLASASWDGTIKLWSPSNGSLSGTIDAAVRVTDVLSLERRNFRLNSVAFAPDGHTLASGGDNGVVIQWNLDTSGDYRDISRKGIIVEGSLRFSAGSDLISTTVAYSPDGKYLASGTSATQRPLLYSVAEGMSADFVANAPAPGFGGRGRRKEQTVIAFSHSGEVIAVNSYDRIWFVRSIDNERLQELQAHTAEVTSLAFSPDGRTLASGSADGTVGLWRVASVNSLATPTPMPTSAASTTLKAPESAYRLAYSPDGRTLAIETYVSKRVQLFDIRSRQILHTFDIGFWIGGMAFSPDNQLLAIADADGKVEMWSVQDGVLLYTLRRSPSSLGGVAFSPDGRSLAVVSNENLVLLWSVKDRKLLHTLESTGSPEDQSPNDPGVTLVPIMSLAFSPDGQALVAVSSNAVVHTWNLSDGHLLTRVLLNKPARTITISGSIVGPTLGLWSVRGVSLVYSSPISSDLLGQVTPIVLSPDSTLVASEAAQNQVGLWSARDGTLIRTFWGHKQGLLSLAFSPDGRSLASGASDRTMRIWPVK